jgi:protoporphyrinogen oxidase
MKMDKNIKIAVLGAGPMGLAVAYQLALDGFKPVLFEADDRVGGMTATFDFNGLEIERYYHFHCISDHAFLKVLDELDIADKMHWVETKMGYWFQNRLQPWGNPLALLSFKGLSLTAKFRYGLHAFLATKRKDWKPLDNVEATGWIKRWVGQEAYDVLWKKLFELKFYDYTTNLSAAWIWSRIRRIGSSRYNIFKEKLGYLDGGSATLLQALKESIEQNGGEIRLSTPVKRITFQQDGMHAIETLNGTETFDKVISTIPLPYVPLIMPDLPEKVLEQYKSLKNIAVVCVIAKLKKPVTDNFWLNTNDEEMDIPGVVEYSNLRPLDHHVVYVPFYMPGEHAKYQDSDEVFINKVKKYLKKINPEIEDNDFIDVRASRYRHAQPICDPSYLEKLPPVALPLDGLYVADTSYYYPEDRGISESIGFGRKMAKDVIA